MISTVKSLYNVTLTEDHFFDIAIFSSSRDKRGNVLFELVKDRSDKIVEIDSKSSDLNASYDADLQALLSANQVDLLTIFIDISCLSAPKMAGVFAALFNAANQRNIEVFVGYVIAAYTPPPEHLPPNNDIRPLSEEFAGWPRYPSARTSLIVGLGYEREKAEGACEYFDSNEIQVFLPISPVSDYEDAVKGNNAQLLAAALRDQRAHVYRLDDPEQTFGQLATLLATMVTRSNPVLLPFGPKLFLALCIIAAEMFRDVGVWDVASEPSSSNRNYDPSECTIAFKLELSPPDIS
jgi:hypothetical protein